MFEKITYDLINKYEIKHTQSLKFRHKKIDKTCLCFKNSTFTNEEGGSKIFCQKQWLTLFVHKFLLVKILRKMKIWKLLFNSLKKSKLIL